MFHTKQYPVGEVDVCIMFEQHVGDLNEAVLSSQRQGSKTILTIQQQHTLSSDTICYFNVRSKADRSQLNLLHGTKN